MSSGRYFAAVCPEGHKEIYDKAEICEKQPTFMDRDEKKAYYVVCPAKDRDGHKCGKRFKVYISCEEYK